MVISLRDMRQRPADDAAIPQKYVYLAEQFSEEWNICHHKYTSLMCESIFNS
jgi:hypothetical protein